MDLLKRLIHEGRSLLRVISARPHSAPGPPDVRSYSNSDQNIAAPRLVAMCQSLPYAPQQIRRYSITSSARASIADGTVRPSALAVFRLITVSYLVGACTGRSPGFSPFKMRST